MFFIKEDLIGKTYKWTENKIVVIRTIPGKELFDRLNGEHLLYMINFFCTSVGSFSITDGQKVEKLITRLPSEVKSEIAVFNWLRGKYLYYWNDRFIV